MTVISPRSRVRLADDVETVVLAVTIRDGGPACYEVAWWNGNARQTAWVEPHELTQECRRKPLRIGFACDGVKP